MSPTRTLRALPLLSAVLCASAAVGQSPPSIDPGAYGAHVTLEYLDGSDRGAGYIENTHLVADERMVMRGDQMELDVRGRATTRGGFLNPSGPPRSVQRTHDFEHRWTGAVRQEGPDFLVHLTWTNVTSPPSTCDLTFRCVPDANVGDALRCSPTRRLGSWGADRVYPSYLRVPLLLARGQWLTVRAHGTDREPGRAEVVP